MSINDPGSAGAGGGTYRRFLAFLLLILAVLVFVAVESLRNLNRAIATSDWVNHTHAVISEADAIVSSLQEAEGALRTYLLTGDRRDRDSCQGAFSDLAGHVEVARALTKSAPAQYQQVTQIESLLEQRAGLARELLQARQAGATEKLQQLLAGDAGGSAVHEIRRCVQSFKDGQNELLAARDTASYLQAQTTRWTVLTGVALDFLLLCGAAWLIRDDLASRRRAATVLQEANERLESKVRQRTAELAAANEQLVAQNLEDRWAKQALEHQLRYSRLIINSITDLMFVVTKPLNISRINPAVVHVTGFASSELIDRPLAEVVRLAGGGEEPEPPLFDPVVQALNEGRDLRDQPAFVTDKHGHTTPVRFSLFPLRDRDKVVGGVVILQFSPPPTPPST